MIKEIKDHYSTYDSPVKKEIYFINPSIDKPIYERTDLLRTYLTFGSLISALMSRMFLREFSLRRERDEFIFNSYDDYPSFCINLIQLSFKNEKNIFDQLEVFLRNSKSDPIMICATTTSFQLAETKEVALASKQLKPDSLRVIGGPHVSVIPEQSLQESEFQVACIGEGVETITELALHCIFERGENTMYKIPGIAYKEESGQIQLNKDRKYYFTLDDYPYPSKSLNKFINDLNDPLKNNKGIIYVLGGFGCPNNCIFCAQKSIHKGRIRERSADSIIAEIKDLCLKGFKKFAIVQETFTSSKKRIDRFCHLIEKHSLNIEWTAESRIDQINYLQLKKMKKSGLKLIQIGLESGDQKILDLIGKRIKINQAINLINWLNELKINTTIYLLVGLPQQDWQSILKTALFFLKHIPYNTATMHTSTSIAIPYPGTMILEDNLVRIMNHTSDETRSQQWQARKPEVYVNDQGEFIGENSTKTDVMTPQEILESLIYLDDMCYSILHAKFDSSLVTKDKLRFLEYANKMLYMIEIRTIRDLIIQAQEHLDYNKKYESLNELLILDKGKEMHFKDVTNSTEKSSQVFRDFLVNISYVNGFNTMKRFSVSNRIKWMKFCCILWDDKRRCFDRFHFSQDNEALGNLLNKYINKIDNQWLWQRLQWSKNDDLTDIKSDSIVDKYLNKLGIKFYIEGKEGILKWQIKHLERG